MPDGLLCNQNISSTSVDSFNIRHKAESILSNIAKHLVALKDNQSRLHDTAKKTYLQVRLNKTLKRIILHIIQTINI
jgi:hypothetical protein